MAIQKTKILNSGVEGNYWVAEPRINMITKKTDVLMLLFKDKASRDAGKLFLERVKVDSIDGIYLTGEQVYTAIKASKLVDEVETNWFADAIDVLEE